MKDAPEQQLACEVLAIRPHDLAERDRGQLHKLIFDHLACCYRGAWLPWGKAMRAWAQKQSAAGAAPLFGGDTETTIANAAFVNATAAHGLELDDTHDESISHPGAPVIASALAEAVASGRDFDAIAAAITAGYEVVARVGAATNAAHVVDDGFHPTSLFTGFGALATVAHLRDFEVEQLRRAWGLMLSMVGGSMQFSQEIAGTTVKRLHGGLAALHAVLAADLSGVGLEGPECALGGRYGLLSMFGRDTDVSRLTMRHADAPEIHRISFKAYPCCRFFHSTLDALDEVTGGFSLNAEKIARYTVGGPEVLSTQHVVRRPESEMAAQYSLPYVIGAATVFGPRSIDGYREDVLGDARVLAIADRVEVEFDAHLQERFPEHFGSWLEIECHDGTTRRAEVLDSIGTPGNPMTREALIAKFDNLVAPLGAGLDGAEVFARVEALSDAESIRQLVAAFRSEPASA